jgi:prolyl oligopeptidase
MSEFGYPKARRMDLTEDVLGHQVSDPYRWLEDAASGERADWLAAEAELFTAERSGWPGREALTARVRQLLGVGFVGTPAWRGERCFFTRRDPGQEHGVLYTSAASGSGSAPVPTAVSVDVLVDPNAIDPSGLTTLDAWQPDKEGRLLAYQLSEGGDEESLLRVLDVTTGALVDGPIDRCRYTNVAWLPGGKAFYYTRRLPPSEVPEGESQYHRRVYLHQVGTPADEDVLIFGTGRDKTDYYSVSVSRDGRWLMVSASRGTAPRNDLWLADLSVCDPASPDLRVFVEGVDALTSVRAGRDGLLYVFTDSGAPRGRLAVTLPLAPVGSGEPGDPADPSSWRELIGEDPEAVLQGYAILDGPELERPVMLACWTRHALSEITVHDLETGEMLAGVPLPGLGSAGGLAERPEGGHEAWFAYTDNTTPPMVLRFDARRSAVDLWAAAPGSVEVPEVTARQVTYSSADGTAVRMLIISGSPGAGAVGALRTPRTPRPTILYGYGGFDISLTPAYSPNILAWVEAGGVYAIASLRGGGEEGEEWHRAGMLEHKQNVFDDFRAAARFLIREGWTTPGQLCISGGSNGGLLVGAALVQEPALYAAVISAAPLLDMVRYERFGLGQTWNVEYGSASDPEQLEWLLAYSPYHHVVPGTEYPAVLFTVFTNDTRVDPVHAYKMCAALQYATASGPSRPVLLRAEDQVGHGARAVSRTAELAGDTLAFAARYTGLDVSVLCRFRATDSPTSPFQDSRDLRMRRWGPLPAAGRACEGTPPDPGAAVHS